MATGLFNLKQVNQAISQGAWSGYIAPKWVEYLVVAGGGGAGGAGGAGGGLLTGIVTVAAGTSYTVTVGSGGTGGPNESTSPATSGSNSVFGSISATGGGKGGTWYSSGQNAVALGATGGSGGGSAGQYTFASFVAGAQGTTGQGNAGGSVIGATGVPYYQAGGGGAGTVGLNAKPDGYAGNGGAGIASSISGSVVTYAGGGGGGRASGGTDANTGKGGVGGGGDAGTTASSSGTAGGGNTGGGGGGSNGSATGSNGGSGIVVVRYPGSVQFFTGGTLSYANGYMIHTFYSSGTLAPTTPTPYVTSYQISRSLRFNSADSAYLNRTPASASNRTTWTWSGWVKRSSFGTDQQLFSAGGSGAFQFLYQTSTDCLYIYDSVSSTTAVITTQVFRDPSAWYHVVLATDTTQPTASNRFKLYINGVQVTSFGTATYPAQNSTLSVNNTVNHSVGSWSGAGGGNFFSGYMTEVNFIDGQQLTPSSFGYTNPATGVWSPLAFVGTYGTNGFYLNFSDNSNTTAATLGKDYSGNGNNWTPNNFSVTAGAGNDSLVDSPTSYGTDTGVGGEVRGNYATLNPLLGSTATLSNGNLNMVVGTTATKVLATIGMSSGKWYWEYSYTDISGDGICGIATSQASITAHVGLDAYSWGYVAGTGNKVTNSSSSAYGASYTTGDVIGVAFDADAGTLVFYKNGTSQGTAYSSLTSGPYFPAFGDNAAGASSTLWANFGQRPFAYTAPSGYKALCTQNLPTPTIGATSTTLANLYFDTSLYTGTNATQSITNAGFQPDLVWPKARSIAYAANIIDSVRGSHKVLIPSSTAAEATSSTANGITAFNSNGFTLGLDTDTTGSTNASGQTFVAWQWKANGGTGVTNTAGSITSTVSANTTSGFSIVTYTGNGSLNATFGHGLGVVPSMIIVKSRSNANAWPIYHSALGANKYIYLNLTQAPDTVGGLWGASGPSSSLVYLPTSTSQGEANGSGTTYVAYCFAEVAGYSKFGSYTGNGSTDGPFVFTGMRPAFLLVKCSSAAENWAIYDVARDTYNVVYRELYPNSSAAETSGLTRDPPLSFDFLSNGFKLRGTNPQVNGNGNTYIFMALASNPFKYSLAR